MLGHHPLIFGLGSDCGDDSAGWLVIDRLRDRGYCESLLFKALHPADLFDAVENQRSVVVCDACHSNGSPGTTRQLTWPTDQLLDHQTRGTHDLSLLEVLTLGQQLNCLPQAVTIWTIEGQAWISGKPPSDEIQEAAISIADRIWNEASYA